MNQKMTDVSLVSALGGSTDSIPTGLGAYFRKDDAGYRYHDVEWFSNRSTLFQKEGFSFDRCIEYDTAILREEEVMLETLPCPAKVRYRIDADGLQEVTFLFALEDGGQALELRNTILAEFTEQFGLPYRGDRTMPMETARRISFNGIFNWIAEDGSGVWLQCSTGAVGDGFDTKVLELSTNCPNVRDAALYNELQGR